MHRHLRSLVLSCGVAAVVPAHAAPARSEWDFIVRLDGRPIGAHRFVVDRDGSGRSTVESDARFRVRVLGWTAYRYDHHARERWSGDCLDDLDARTNDDGRVTTVHETAVSAHGCLMSFAYWSASLPAQGRLLDPATGRIVHVRIEPLPPAPVETGHGPVDARGWRIVGLRHPIDIRWDGDEWVALDTVVDGRRLTYRLR